jgi:hypothetical protein
MKSLAGAEETQIIAAQLQDRDVGSNGHIFVDAAKHHGVVSKDNSNYRAAGKDSALHRHVD